MGKFPECRRIIEKQIEITLKDIENNLKEPKKNRKKY